MIRHIDSELQDLKDLVLQMGGCVEKTLDAATGAVLKFNPDALAQVQTNEAKINQFQIRIDEACVTLLAKQAPVARDLRMVMAIVKINTDLERMGDQAVNIALTATDFAKLEGAKIPPKMHSMVNEVKAVVRSALDSFARQDVNLARQVLEQDDRIDEMKDETISENKILMQRDPSMVDQGLSLIMTAKNLERLADHATNIAEEVIYLATGADVRHGQGLAANTRG